MARYRARTRPFRVPVYSHITDREDSGVHLDEPSSPISKHFEARSERDTVRSSCRDGVYSSHIKKQEHDNSGYESSRCRYDREKKSNPSLPNESSTSLNDQRGENSYARSGLTDDYVENSSGFRRKKNETTGTDVSVSFTLDEDEGLDIRDSNSSINKGDDSYTDSQKFHSDSSNENSDTEISENLESIELSEVSVEVGDDLKDEVQTCGAEDSRKHKSKDAKKKRFRRLMRKPAIKRSQSLGCEKDLVPEHALFLQFNPADVHPTESADKEKNESQRRTIYKTSSADAAMMAGEVLPLDTQELTKSKSKSSIAKNVRRKLQKLHRRNTDSFLGAAIMSVKGSKVTQAEALEWGNSFDALLMDKNGLEMFKNFLKSEFSDENIEFWIACEEYKTTRTNKLTSRAQKIYSDFVAVNAPRQINLDSKTRLETVTNMENPTRDLFQQAQKRIQFLMENDSYKRFLETDTYKNLIGPSTGPIS